MNIKSKKTSSIKKKLLLSFLTAVLLPSLVIGISSYIISISILKEKISHSFEETLSYISDSIESELDQVNKITEYIFIEKNVKKLLTHKNDNLYEYLQIEKDVNDSIYNYAILNAFDHVNALRIYREEALVFSYYKDIIYDYYSDEKIIHSPYMEQVYHNRGKVIFDGSNHEKYSQGITSGYTLSVFREILDITYTKKIGAMFINFDVGFLSEKLLDYDFGEDSKILIIDNKNQVVNDEHIDVNKYMNTEEQRYKTHSFSYEDKDIKKILFNAPIEKYNWNVIGIVSTNSLTKDNIAILQITLLAFLGSYIILIFVWYYLLSKIIQPITQLRKTMHIVREGHFEKKARIYSNDEIGMLASDFNFMIKKISDLFIEVVEEQKKMNEAEYKALQAQIMPHFLYNTLNSIRWMAIIHKADNIKEVVDVLARILRNTTDKKKQFITLKDEFDQLRDYIYLQKLAYNCSFDVEWDIEPKTEDVSCIKFMLQPIVENAIFYGVKPKDGIGRISIRSSLDTLNEEEVVIISIRDNGVGMSEEKMKSILMENSATGKFSSIGIYNVDSRLKMMYGEQYGIKIHSIINEYTVVTVTIPAITSE